MNLQLFNCILSICFAFAQSNSGPNAFLHKYSEIHYDRSSLHSEHRRVQRSTDKTITLELSTDSREFTLKLHPSDKHHLLNKHIEVHTETRRLVKTPDDIHYEGYLVDEPQTSFVKGSIIDGLFSGIIKSEVSGTYQVEPSARYNASAVSHSIIYHADDIKNNEEIKASGLYAEKESNGVGCGSHSEQVHERMAKDQVKRITRGHQGEQVGYKYSAEANVRSNSRQKRAASQKQFPQSKSVCSLYLKVDPSYYNQIFNSEGDQNADTTMSYIVSYLSSYVDNLNTIFTPLELFTDTTKTSYYQGVSFKIYRIKVFTDSSCTGSGLTANEKKICDKYLDAVTFLNHVSLDDYSQYCLGYAFTGRDFGDGTLGLAWVATADGRVGGLCESRANVQGADKSLNTGIVTINNYQSRVPELVTRLTMSHEVGHSFGSEHDPSGVCSPGGSAGNYIMYSRATTGQDANNNQFSSCSLTQIGSVFSYAMTNKFCLSLPAAAICGNGIIEEGEQCDCGFSDQCTDRCCNPSTCQLAAGATCSPSQGPCCESGCTFSATSKTCFLATDCKANIQCTGTGATCPAASAGNGFQPDLTACNGQTQVCINGECSGSICLRYSLERCYLTGDLSDPSVNKRDLCNVACNYPNTTGVCTSSFAIPEFINDFNTGVVMKPGATCNGVEGYCDVFSSCRSANNDAQLNRLVSLLLTNVTVEDIKQWVKTYWWAVLIFCIIFVVLFNLLIWGLSKLMPSSNPNKPKKHNKTFPRNSARQQRSDSFTSTSRITSHRRDKPVFTNEISDNLDQETYFDNAARKERKNKNLFKISEEPEENDSNKKKNIFFSDELATNDSEAIIKNPGTSSDCSANSLSTKAVSGTLKIKRASSSNDSNYNDSGSDQSSGRKSRMGFRFNWPAKRSTKLEPLELTKTHTTEPGSQEEAKLTNEKKTAKMSRL